MIALITMLPQITFDCETLREPGEARMLRRTLVLLACIYTFAIGVTLSFFVFWLLLAWITVKALRQKYLAEAIEVDAQQLPQLHQLLLTCAARLGVDAPKLFISHDPGIWPVYTIPLPSAAIMLHASWVKMLTPDELSFFIYHELAHGKLGHRRYLNPVNVLENVGAISWLLTTPLEVMRYLLRPWLRLADFSADRVALACLGGRLEIAAAALMKVTAGDEMYDQVDAQAFICQARRLPASWLLTLHEVCTARLGAARRVSRLARFVEEPVLAIALGTHVEPERVGWIRWLTGGWGRRPAPPALPPAEVTPEPQEDLPLGASS